MAEERGDTVIVTGGAGGLGAAVAAELARCGWAPFVLDRRPSDRFPHILVDLGQGREAEAAVVAVAERCGGVAAVVTAAGIDACGPLASTPAQDWERVIAVNLLGTAAVVRAAVPYLEQCRGSVVTVASTLGVRALPDATAYCASKFGVVGFTRALAAELQGRVGVTLLIPGGMDTGFFEGRPAQYRPGPDARLNRPEHVARTVAFALDQPPGCEIRELVVAPSTEPSWP